MSDHVLLIGIDAYDGATPLNGCVNDIDGVQRVLLQRMRVPLASIRRLASPRHGTTHPTDVPARGATLAEIREELDDLASEAVQPGDRVFIYYSGHGTQCPVEVGDRTYVREALLPKDHYMAPERRFLFDFELNERLARIAARTTSVSFVLDACCSAGATRDSLQPAASAVRYVRTTEPYVPLRQENSGPAGPRGLARNIAASVSACQVIAACRDDERALENDVDGRMQGVLTRAFLAELDLIADGDLHELIWGRVWRSVVASVLAKNPAQNPQMFGSFGRRVFGGPLKGGDTGYGVTRDGDSYRIDAGTLAGVTEFAEVAVYGSAPETFPPAPNRDGQVGVVKVRRTTASSAWALPLGDAFELPAGARGRLVKAGAHAKLVVSVNPPDPALAADIDASPLLRMARMGEGSGVSLLGLPDGAREVADDLHGPRDGADRATLVVIPSSERAVPYLEHYFRYSLPIRMACACTDLPNKLQLRLLDCNGFQGDYPREKAAAPDLPACEESEQGGYELWAGEGERPIDRVALELANVSDVRLHVNLFGCMASGRVILLGERTLNSRERTVVWAGGDVGMPFVVEAAPGKHLVVDRLVAIATTRADVSLSFLEVAEGFPVPGRGTRDLGAARNRDVGKAPVEQWTSVMCILRSRA